MRLEAGVDDPEVQRVQARVVGFPRQTKPAESLFFATPELLNSDPHVAGWIAKIKLSVPEEIDRLLSPTDYQAYLGEG